MSLVEPHLQALLGRKRSAAKCHVGTSHWRAGKMSVANPRPISETSRVLQHAYILSR